MPVVHTSIFQIYQSARILKKEEEDNAEPEDHQAETGTRESQNLRRGIDEDRNETQVERLYRPKYVSNHH